MNVHGEGGVHCGGEWIPASECKTKWNKSGVPRSRDCVDCPHVPRSDEYDVAIIGAGCVGSCVARELSKTTGTICVIDQADDISDGGATKANSGIVHAGYDDKPGTRRAQFCWPGNQMFPALDKELHFGFQKNGSLVVARSNEDMEVLEDLKKRGSQNGVRNLRIIDQTELREMEPGISEDAIGALYSPDAGTVTPYEFAIAVAENAACNGVDFLMSRKVTAVARNKGGGWEITTVCYTTSPFMKSIAIAMFVCLLGVFMAITQSSASDFFSSYAAPSTVIITIFSSAILARLIYVAITLASVEKIKAKYIVNAAGCFSDKISAMADAGEFTINPRWGEYMLLNKDQGKHSRHVLFPAPSKMGKGIVLQPTLWGNLLLGPTARDASDAKAMAMSPTDLMLELISKCRELVPGFDAGKVIHSFAGARAKNSRGDWIIEESPTASGFIQAAGVDSPGLAGSPAIAIEVVNLLRKAGFKAPKDPHFNPHRNPIIVPKTGWKGIKINDTDPVKNVVCKCEKVTEAEIIDAIHRPLRCDSTQAVRKRTRAGMGHCQGQFCEPRVKEVISRELPKLGKVAGRPWPASSILPQRWLSDREKDMIGKLR